MILAQIFWLIVSFGELDLLGLPWRWLAGELTFQGLNAILP